MSGRFYCGTSGWNYNHWREVFYPKELPQSKWLNYYSQHFDTVEINNSFYRLPEKSTFESWRNQSKDGFTFAVKASRFLTHIKKLKDPEEPVDRLISHACGLGEKLGPILYQFQPGWHLNLDRLEHLLQILPKEIRHVFEFRDESWQVEKVFDMLRQYNAGYCIMSAPDLPCNLISTADFVYIRMHSGGADTEGCYTDDSLAEWADHIRQFLPKNDVYIYFNNDYEGFAVRNAKTILSMIE